MDINWKLSFQNNRWNLILKRILIIKFIIRFLDNFLRRYANKFKTNKVSINILKNKKLNLKPIIKMR